MRVSLRYGLLALVSAAAFTTSASADVVTVTAPGTDDPTIAEVKQGDHPQPATSQPDPNALKDPPSWDHPPPGYRLAAKDAYRIARAVPKIRDELKDNPKATHRVFIKGFGTWQVSFYNAKGSELGQVQINDRAAKVLEAWTGVQVAWTMARGYPGAFGRKSNAVYIWIPLCVLFILPFITLRRPFRMLHLDLLVLLSFSISFAFFTNAQIGKSVPFSFVPMVYLVLRLLWLARSRAARAEPLKLLVPVSWITVALVFLIGFRVGLNIINSNVIDVGYAGVIGADKLTHGEKLYGSFPKDNGAGDTYGPVNYYAYIPFEQLLPWHGKWDDLPAAHFAAIFFDLMTILLLFLLGRQIRGPTLGVVLAYAWVTYPFTLLAQTSNSNDSLVAMLLVAVLLAARSAVGRGVLLALASLTKFAPLALVPLVGLYRANFRRVVWFGLAFLGTAAVVMLPVLLDGQLEDFYRRTIEYQANREAPFSIWGYYGGLELIQHAVQLGAVVLGVVAAFVLRRGTVVQLAAAAGALMMLLQMGVTYWFYLYIVWMVPFAFVAIFGRYGDQRESEDPKLSTATLPTAM